MGIAFLLSVILKEFVRTCVYVKIKEYLLNERKSYHVTEEKSDSKSQVTFYQQHFDP